MYLIPGLGADGRLFGPQKQAFPHMNVIEWEVPHSGESIADYARRLSEKLPQGPLILGGVSFGGVMAQEIAALRPPNALVLIATLAAPTDLCRPFSFGRFLPAFSLDFAARLTQACLKIAAPRMGRQCRGVNRQLMAEMLASADPRFLTWARRAVLFWQPTLLPPMPTLRLHGTEDRLLMPGEKSGIVWIESAGHLVNMTHADQVNAAIADFLARESSFGATPR